MSGAEVPVKFGAHRENYYRASSSKKKGVDFARKCRASQTPDRKHIKRTALALACAIYDSDPIHALSSKERYAKLHSLQSMYLSVGDANSEGFLVGVEGRRVYIAFCGSQIDFSARGSLHLTQMVDFQMTPFGGAEHLANAADLRGMAGYMQAMNNTACDLAHFVLTGFNHIIVCGHSRGGAIAFLKLIEYYISNNVDASKHQDECAPLIEAIAFGSPYCVNQSVVNFLDSRKLSQRFTTVANHEDIVAAIIPAARASSPKEFQQFFRHVKSTSSSLVAVCMDLAKRQLEDVADVKKQFSNYHPLGVYELLGSQGELSCLVGSKAVNSRLSKFMACYIVEAEVLMCMNKAGDSYKARGSGCESHFKTPKLAQKHRQHWRKQLIENGFEICNWSIEIVELIKTEWYKEDSSKELSDKGKWLEEIGVWNILKVRKWIRERKLRHDGQADFRVLDEVMPDNNMWWRIGRVEEARKVIGWS
ncbi:hypothetical protein HDU77_001093 [Chytriomyces hyalinus]|nr:hypothetical protein HDU77_001093 [Chytriomyces hyalinus]